MRKKIIIICAVAATVFFVVIYFRPSRHEGVFYPMGGIPLRVVTYGTKGAAFSKNMEAAQKRVADLEDVFSSHRPSSELSHINRDVGEGSFEMSPDMERVIAASKRWWEKSGGAFDVTVGPLIDLWREAGKTKRVPSASEITNSMRSVGMEKIEIKDDQIKIKTKIKNIELGLGGIAKGDVVDQVAVLLVSRGVKRGVVDAGGDVLAFGDGTFTFGIQDPTAKAGERLIGKIETVAGAVVTSGNYERFTVIDGKRYSHIIDPRSGMPVDNGLVSVTVTAPACIDADALATALTVMGRERAIELLRNEPAYEGILIEKSGDKYIVWVDSGLKDKVHFEEPWGNSIRTF